MNQRHYISIIGLDLVGYYDIIFHTSETIDILRMCITDMNNIYD